MQVQVIFHDDDIRCTVIQPNGEEKSFYQVSAMLNWCAENNLQPYVALPDGKQPL